MSVRQDRIDLGEFPSRSSQLHEFRGDGNAFDRRNEGNGELQVNLLVQDDIRRPLSLRVGKWQVHAAETE